MAPRRRSAGAGVIRLTRKRSAGDSPGYPAPSAPFVGYGETTEPLNELRRHDGTVLAQWVGLGHTLSEHLSGDVEYWRNGLFVTSFRCPDGSP
jgi:hypothetical protein